MTDDRHHPTDMTISPDPAVHGDPELLISADAPEGVPIADALAGSTVFLLQVDDPDGLIVPSDVGLGLAVVLPAQS